MDDKTGLDSGAIRAVIFDWAGTTVDFGSLAPTSALVEVFHRAGVPITAAEARGAMGRNKRDHLRDLLNDPGIHTRWTLARNADPAESDVDDLYRAFLPLQEESIAKHATPIPGVIEAVAILRERGIFIGSNTGYNRHLMSLLLPAAGALGYAPDVVVTSDDNENGRPSPDMALAVAAKLGVFNPTLCVKVDDTPAGISEGLNAGMWTVGVAVTGNANGRSLESWMQLSDEQRAEVRRGAHAELTEAGAHVVVDTAASIVEVVDQFNQGLRSGLLP